MDREGIRRACMALPGVTLDHPFGDDHDAYKVGGKMFAIVGGEGGVSFKVSDIAFEVLTEEGRARPAPYLARAKWVAFDRLADLDAEAVRDWLASAYALVAARLTRKARAELGLAV